MRVKRDKFRNHQSNRSTAGGNGSFATREMRPISWLAGRKMPFRLKHKWSGETEKMNQQVQRFRFNSAADESRCDNKTSNSNQWGTGSRKWLHLVIVGAAQLTRGRGHGKRDEGTGQGAVSMHHHLLCAGRRSISVSSCPKGETTIIVSLTRLLRRGSQVRQVRGQLRPSTALTLHFNTRPQTKKNNGLTCAPVNDKVANCSVWSRGKGAGRPTVPVAEGTGWITRNLQFHPQRIILIPSTGCLHPIRRMNELSCKLVNISMDWRTTLPGDTVSVTLCNLHNEQSVTGGSRALHVQYQPIDGQFCCHLVGKNQRFPRPQLLSPSATWINSIHAPNRSVGGEKSQREREAQQRATTSLITSDQIRSQPCCRFYTKTAATDCHRLRRIRHRVTLPDDVNNQQTRI